MIHLIVHLVWEIRSCGPIFLRWMYLVERYMKVLKGYTKNQYRSKASIVERYVPQSCHDCTIHGRDTQGFNVVTMDRQQLSQAHL